MSLAAIVFVPLLSRFLMKRSLCALSLLLAVTRSTAQGYLCIHMLHGGMWFAKLLFLLQIAVATALALGWYSWLMGAVRVARSICDVIYLRRLLCLLLSFP
jgi:hypothetical protein